MPLLLGTLTSLFLAKCDLHGKFFGYFCDVIIILKFTLIHRIFRAVRLSMFTGIAVGHNSCLLVCRISLGWIEYTDDDYRLVECIDLMRFDHT